MQFHKDAKRLYLQTNKGDAIDRTEFVLMDAATGKTELVESDPDKQVDFGGAWFSEATDELMATFYLGDRFRIYPKDKQTQQDLERIRKQLPPGNIDLGSASEDMRYQLVSIWSDLEPGATYLYDRQKGDFKLQYRVRPELTSQNLCVMKPVRYKARDGLEIPAYLTLPRGVPAKNLAVIIRPHGGPWARDVWSYNGFTQFLANRGYAVLQPNFRGSTGYGKKFLNAGNKQWGIGAMQHDISDGVKYLVDQGIADPKRVGIFGGSYGGYATLAGVTFTPELYACGVPYVAPSNLITLIESFPAYWRPFMKGSWYMRVGDPADPADRKDLESRSPLNFADRIRVPLLVVHGANDPRVKQAESDRIVVALREKGHPVEYLVAPDEGHGFRAPENNLALATAMEKFLAKHLGGRYQQSMNEVTAKRLGEITIDVASVALPGATSLALLSQAETAPLPKPDGNLIKPTSLQYAVTLAMGQQTMNLDKTRTLEEASRDGKTCLRIVESATTPMGKATDTFDLDRTTLEPVAREASGMGTLKLQYGSGKVSGEMGGGGQSMPVDVTLKAPVWGDGPAFEVALAALPLAAGYKTTVRIFEPLTQKVRPMALEVTGEETTAVAAGSFPSLIVAVKPLDDDPSGTSTCYVMKGSPHHLVKCTAKLPAMMGGGDMTSELKSVAAEVGAR